MKILLELDIEKLNDEVVETLNLLIDEIDFISSWEEIIEE